MLIDEHSMNNKIIVVLADTEEKALAYGNSVRPDTTVRIMPMHQRSELYLLYGHRGMLMVITPGTLVQDWHTELEHHIAVGRIRPMRNYRRVQIG